MTKSTVHDGHYPYVYTSAQLAKYFGITVKGIEYYEKKQLIAPARVGASRDRAFNLTDTYRLFMSRYLHQAECSIQETLTMLDEPDLSNVVRQFDDKITQLKRKQLWLSRVIDRLSENCALLKRAENGPFFEQVTSPAYQWLFLREMDGPHTSNQQQSNEYRAWNELMPITDASLRYSADELKKLPVEKMAEDTYLPAEIGMMMDDNDFEQFDLTASERTYFMQSRHCVHTILIGNAQKIETAAWLRPTFDYLTDHNLTMDGDIVTSLLFVLNDEQDSVRFDEAWVPVKHI